MQKTDWTIHPSSPSYVVLDVTNRGTITTISLYIGPSLAWWPTNNQMILVQALSWPVWESSLLQYLIFPAAVLVKKCHDARCGLYDTYDLSKCDGGGASWGQKVRPGRRTQGGPKQSRNTQCSSSLQHFFALATVNLKKSRKLIGEKHIYFNMFVTKAFIHHPPLNCSGAYCSADTPHGGQHAERGSLKVQKMEFLQKAHIWGLKSYK